MAARYRVKHLKQFRHCIVDMKTGFVVEGGFFSRDAALDRLAEWNGELTSRGGPDHAGEAAAERRAEAANEFIAYR